GINCYDAFKKEYFTLRGIIISWLGDTPRLTKLMGLTGHNSYQGCQDIIYLFYENIAKYMFKHWTGIFFLDASQNNEPYVLAKSV
ncbi:15234_t:CDS:1, partial [Racocetra persica]